MTYLVGEAVLNIGDKATIIWNDGTKTHVEYIDSYGYNHILRPLNNGNDIKLSNHFMHLKGITVVAGIV